MATLLIDDGIIESDLGDIARQLAPLDIYLKHYDPGTSILFPNLLDQDVLTDVSIASATEINSVQEEPLTKSWA